MKIPKITKIKVARLTPACNDLIEKYPTLFIKEEMVWPMIECGKGWYDLIDNLCSEIKRHAEHIKQDVHIAQVKEKFGGLRFYTHGTDEQIYGMISFAEAFSFSICEECGSPGKLREDRAWWKVRCDKCLTNEK
jgi:hypothetical protein